jgi:hypothetical protein
MRIFNLKWTMNTAVHAVVTSFVVAVGAALYGAACGAILGALLGSDGLATVWGERFLIAGALAGAVAGVLAALDGAWEQPPVVAAPRPTAAAPTHLPHWAVARTHGWLN